MALLEKQLVVKKSEIPGAGRGLFTKVLIPKGTRIVEYKGRITTWKEAQLNSDNPYIFYVNNNRVIDALTYKKAFARYANDATGTNKNKSVKNNAEYVNEGNRIYIEALRDIPAGAEILVGYGKEYWKTMRDNAVKR